MFCRWPLLSIIVRQTRHYIRNCSKLNQITVMNSSVQAFSLVTSSIKVLKCYKGSWKKHFSPFFRFCLLFQKRLSKLLLMGLYWRFLLQERKLRTQSFEKKERISGLWSCEPQKMIMVFIKRITHKPKLGA